MQYRKAITFVDGENLVFRYQAMVKAGRQPHPHIPPIHVPDAFVWTSGVTQMAATDMIRAFYFTSLVGDESKVDALEETISQSQYVSPMTGLHQKLIPKVHKKPSQGKKEKVIDMDVCIHVMRAALAMPIDRIYLITGDGDYLELVQEITRTNKQLTLGALSSGLNPALRRSVESFVDLDPHFFVPVT